MTKFFTMQEIKAEAMVRIGGIVAAVDYINKRKRTVTKEAEAFRLGLLHAVAVLESIDPSGTERTNEKLTAGIRGIAKAMGF